MERFIVTPKEDKAVTMTIRRQRIAREIQRTLRKNKPFTK